MYLVDPNVWIKVARMHFSGSAACLLQPVEYHLSRLSWQEFVHMVMDRFGKDQHEVLVRQLLHSAKHHCGRLCRSFLLAY